MATGRGQRKIMKHLKNVSLVFYCCWPILSMDIRCRHVDQYFIYYIKQYGNIGLIKLVRK